jgi:hypothetical protein
MPMRRFSTVVSASAVHSRVIQMPPVSIERLRLQLTAESFSEQRLWSQRTARTSTLAINSSGMIWGQAVPAAIVLVSPDAVSLGRVETTRNDRLTKLAGTHNHPALTPHPRHGA